MAGTNILCTDYWLGQNFATNPGYSAGSDTTRMMSVSEIIAKYRVSIWDITSGSGNYDADRRPFQNEIFQTYTCYWSLASFMNDSVDHLEIYKNDVLIVSGNTQSINPEYGTFTVKHGDRLLMRISHVSGVSNYREVTEALYDGSYPTTSTENDPAVSAGIYYQYSSTDGDIRIDFYVYDF